MYDRTERIYYVFPQLGCLLVLAVLAMFCLLPLFLVDAMGMALRKLHLSPEMAMLSIVGMLAGGLVNIPLVRLQREEEQPLLHGTLYGPLGWIPIPRQPTQTILAINFGGCIVPMLLAIYEIGLMVQASEQRVLLALLLASAVNVIVCYRASRVVPGLGIAMPGFVSPLVAVGMAWILLGGEYQDTYRAPVAFVAGVAGPLIGADLLHFRDFTRVAAGVVSIGGAGTFDGIVLSGLLAALIA